MGKLVISKKDAARRKISKPSVKLSIKGKYLIVTGLSAKKKYFKQKDIERLVYWLYSKGFI